MVLRMYELTNAVQERVACSPSGPHPRYPLSFNRARTVFVQGLRRARQGRSSCVSKTGRAADRSRQQQSAARYMVHPCRDGRAIERLR